MALVSNENKIVKAIQNASKKANPKIITSGKFKLFDGIKTVPENTRGKLSF